jgi:hypothetical protein
MDLLNGAMAFGVDCHDANQSMFQQNVGEAK